MSTIVATVALSANSAKTEVNEKKLIKYVKRNIVKNSQVKVNGLTIIETQTHEKLPGWKILLTTMDLTYKKKEIHAPEVLFLKDGLITGHLVNLKTGKDYRDDIKPSVPEEMYNDAHLLFGNKDAEHKVLIFSDPQCPFCQEIVPEVFNAAKKHPTKMAVYYYHLPLLRLHPVSDVLTRVMHVAQEKNKLDVFEKIYSLRINYRETNVTKILKAIKKHTKITFTKEEISEKKVIDALKSDELSASKMMVNGTPTIYIDGKWDKMRTGYKKLIK
jgi:predicted DsbA family dithiol-disulfide isomerase